MAEKSPQFKRAKNQKVPTKAERDAARARLRKKYGPSYDEFLDELRNQKIADD